MALAPTQIQTGSIESQRANPGIEIETNLPVEGYPEPETESIEELEVRLRRLESVILPLSGIEHRGRQATLAELRVTGNQLFAWLPECDPEETERVVSLLGSIVTPAPFTPSNFFSTMKEAGSRANPQQKVALSRFSRQMNARRPNPID